MEVKDLDKLLQERARRIVKDKLTKMNHAIERAISDFTGWNMTLDQDESKRILSIIANAKAWAQRVDLDNYKERYDRILQEETDRLLKDFEHFADFVKKMQTEEAQEGR